MPMRQDCKYFESRTYANGETVRKCDLDLAPEAPWRCPDDCPKYEQRMADVGWSLGSLVRPSTPEEPEMIELNDDAAEDIVNAAGPEILREVQAEQAKREARESARWKKIFRRKR